jgi:dTDP-4-amino-4,6-dideoxygalactose transaminase
MNMTDLTAAICREQLRKLDDFNNDRLSIKNEYDKHFKQLNRGHYLYVIEVENRREFMDKMESDGVELSYHYRPLYDQPAYKADPKEFPYLESIKDKIVTLPLYPKLTNGEVQKIIQLTKKHAKLKT